MNAIRRLAAHIALVMGCLAVGVASGLLADLATSRTLYGGGWLAGQVVRRTGVAGRVEVSECHVEYGYAAEAGPSEARVCTGRFVAASQPLVVSHVRLDTDHFSDGNPFAPSTVVPAFATGANARWAYVDGARDLLDALTGLLFTIAFGLVGLVAGVGFLLTPSEPKSSQAT